MSSSSKTIIAQSTPHGSGAIAIVRMSGPSSISITEKILERKINDQVGKRDSLLVNLYDSQKNIFDQALLLIFKAPKSYTGENLIEFHCHGNQLIVNKLIETALVYGASLASPGEFTQRAYLNNKLKLSEAEAIMDLIKSKTEKLLFKSANQLLGSLGTKISLIENNLLEVLSAVQAPMDFPIETEFSEIDEELVFKNILDIDKLINKLYRDAQTSAILRNGLKTVILGRPNVGKSSLLNLLLSSERAIVSSEAGTTRDFISEEILIRDIPITLIDTAGLRSKTNSEIEKLGIQRAQGLAKEAELVLFVFDFTEGFLDEDESLLQSIINSNKEAKIILLSNKYDLDESEFAKSNMNSFLKDHDIPLIQISAKTSFGLEELENKIESLFNIDSLEGDFEFSLSQRQSLILNSMNNVLNEINPNIPLEIVSSKIQELIDLLNELKGEGQFKSEKTANRIFGEFCIGK
ncbi:MAG: tRNA uridine-5-carboxymethylaminomethyl(34) synthesis GTPase MnmE [Candidatus Caenarcaniphilales bacterium]|nr:tRNA uridine-5-carboxymethylaminomethyl(34) synthesis GTPase MnmE [Candidatus Caenarcaniphilales bacterium]